MFQLTQTEFEILKSQIVISSWGGTRKLPYAFTEQGVAMLSSVLRSKKALWVDIIVNSKGYKNKEPNWKATAYFLITVANALNVFVLLLWLDFLNINARKYLFIFESKSLLTSALGGFLNFGLPFAIINYYAIFHKKRYLKLITKHPAPYNRRLALIYILGSILLVVITVIITA